MSVAYDTIIWTGQLQFNAFWMFENNWITAQVILMNRHRHYLIVLQLVFQSVIARKSSWTAIKVQ